MTKQIKKVGIIKIESTTKSRKNKDVTTSPVIIEVINPYLNDVNLDTTIRTIIVTSNPIIIALSFVGGGHSPLLS